MECREYEINGAKVTGYFWSPNPELQHPRRRPALVVCPGGAYRFVSKREMDAPAMEFLSMGYQVFILEYSVMEMAAGLRPLKQLAETVRFVRTHREEFNVAPDKIAVMGFSAGGHLAASLGAYWQEEQLGFGEECRPDALILSYPVISTAEFCHEESSELVSGGDPEVREMMNLQKHITADYPPAFIWTGGEDTCVPPENSLMLACELKRAGVPFELHMFGSGEHGTSVCTAEVETPDDVCRAWIPLSKKWVNRRFNYLP